MARNRTTPEPRTSTHQDRIMQETIHYAYDNAGVPIEANQKVTYVVNHYDDSGVLTGSDGEGNGAVIAKADWPSAMRNRIRGVHDDIIDDAETKGLYGAGTDTEDLT